MKYLLTGEEMTGADMRTAQVIGIPSIVLMERAALSVAQELVRVYPDRKKVTVIAGPGNNGADGLAAGRLLIDSGYSVQFLLLSKKEPPEGSSMMIQRRILDAYGAQPEVFTEEALYAFGPQIIIDALFGTGLGRPLSGDAARIVEAVERYRGSRDCRVVGVDLPSGISSEDGSVMGCAVRCDLTVTFAYYKRGHFLYPGCSYCGRTVLHRIGIEDRSFACEGGSLPEMYSLERSDAADILGKRDPGGNKGTFGKILIVAGSYAMCGAALMCAEACMRSGAGMVKIFTREENRVIIQERLPEAMLTVYDVLPEDPSARQAAAEKIRRSLLDDLAWADIVAAGPGIGRGAEAHLLVETILSAAAQPGTASQAGTAAQPRVASLADRAAQSGAASMAAAVPTDGVNTVSAGARLKGLVLDADALRLLAADARLDTLLRERKRDIDCILTPHLAEFADLAHVSVKEAADNRIALMREVAARYGCTIIGKDARTLIVSDGVRQICMITNGNSGMATAGSGDVLTGITAAMLAAVKSGRGAGRDAAANDAGHDAAQVAAFLHAEAGDFCKEKQTEQSMLATDLIRALGEVFGTLNGRRK